MTCTILLPQYTDKYPDLHEKCVKFDVRTFDTTHSFLAPREPKYEATSSLALATYIILQFFGCVQFKMELIW